MATLTREEWLKARLTGIGGSEAPALFGEHPWLSPYELAMQKRGLVKSKPDDDVLWWGRQLEPATRARFEHEHKTSIHSPPAGKHWLRQSEPEPWLLASIDGQVARPDGLDLYEGKTAAFAGDRWVDGEPPPIYTQIQTQQYLHVYGLDAVWIAVLLLGRRECRYYRLERHDAFIERLRNVAGDWWRRYMVRGEDPPTDGSESCKKALKARWPRPEPGRVVHLGADWLERANRLTDLKAQAAETAKNIANIENLLRAEIGDAEKVMLPDGSSYRQSFVKETTIPAHTRAAYTQLRRSTGQ